MGVCFCLLDCLLSDRPVLPEEEAQNSVGMEQCSWGCNPPVDHNHVIFSEGSASSLNSLPEGPFTDTESWHPFTSDSLSSVTKPKGSNPHTLADQIDPEEFRKTITEGDDVGTFTSDYLRVHFFIHNSGMRMARM